MSLQRVDGSPDVSPLVCIHGFSGSWRNWVQVAPLVGDRHDVMVARLAGHARGPRLAPSVPPTVTALADQLERDLDEAGLDRPHLVGNSLGGWLALELAARGRARSVMALAPALGWEPHGRHLTRLRWKLTLGHRAYASIAPYGEKVLMSATLRRQVMRAAMKHGERITGQDAASFVRDNQRCTVYHELLTSFLSTEHTLDPIDVPVSIVWSEHDELIPHRTYGSRFSQLVPAARFSTMAGVGHVPMYDDPALVADTILAFTGQIEAATVR